MLGSIFGELYIYTIIYTIYYIMDTATGLLKRARGFGRNPYNVTIGLGGPWGHGDLKKLLFAYARGMREPSF